MDLLTHILSQGNKSPHRIKVKITSSSPKNEITGFMSDGAIKVRIHAVPEQGKANAELIRFLAKELDIDTDNIELISGHTSSRKELLITL